MSTQTVPLALTPLWRVGQRCPICGAHTVATGG